MNKISSLILKFWIILSCLITIISIAIVIVYIVIKGLPVISWEFLTSPPAAFGSGDTGGIFPAIIGSLLLTFVAGFSSVMIACPVAIYKTMFLKNHIVNNLISAVINLIASVPSIVLGLFGYVFFLKGLNMDKSALAGGFTLAIMIFPHLEVRIERSIKEINDTLIYSALSLGVSKGYLIRQFIFPMIKNELWRALTLQMGYAMGATAPLIMTAVVLNAPVPGSLTEPVMALPFHLYILINQGISQEGAYGTALVLLALVFLINTFAVLLPRKANYD